jgi:hypothetical protein
MLVQLSGEEHGSGTMLMSSVAVARLPSQEDDLLWRGRLDRIRRLCSKKRPEVRPRRSSRRVIFQHRLKGHPVHRPTRREHQQLRIIRLT